jgi:maleylacetate reductase
MGSFVYTGLPARVIFGVGTTATLPQELERLGISRALVLTTPSQAEEGDTLCKVLGKRSAGLFTRAAMHTPTDVTEQALNVFSGVGADGIVAFGGGSTIGLGKAIALRTDAPQVVLPTTYAGSEMTAILGQTEAGRKSVQTTLKVLPETVIYDVLHTLGLPPVMSVTSGMNAIAHAVEALYSEKANPLLSLMAEEGITKMAAALAKVSAAPKDIKVRSDALYGAWLCATCLGSGGVALHHKLCHVLGGALNLPHAETHAIVLPHAIAYNARAIPEAMAALERALDSPLPAKKLHGIVQESSAPTALKDLGMKSEDIERIIDLALQTPYPNPRPLEREALRKLLDDAWAGKSPEA